MSWFSIWIWSLCFLSAVSAVDPFVGLIRQECFPLTETTNCNTTLAESFEAQNPVLGLNEPTTYAFLFTPSSPDVAEPLHLCGGKLPDNSSYDPDANTEIFIHGWLDGVCRTGWMREMKEQLFIRQSRLKDTKYNVILVDWSWGNTIDYAGAGVNSKVVGEQVGYIIKNIMEKTKCGPEKFHVVGHSLGAIAGGFVGRSVPRLRRITGLDPAFAPSKYAAPNERLTYRDAKIVDIIHSNGARCFPLGIGDSRFLGHADFYPNGGFIQLSCYPYILIALLKLDLLYGITSLIPSICSHLQSVQFYKASINPEGCEFIGVASTSYRKFRKNACKKGDQFAVMGMNYEEYIPTFNNSGRQKYFLDTTLLCPYYDGSNVKDCKIPINTSCSNK